MAMNPAGMHGMGPIGGGPNLTPKQVVIAAVLTVVIVIGFVLMVRLF